MECVDIVDILLALVHFPLNPMSIKVSEQVVDVFGGGSVSIPFADVEGKEGLISVGF